LSAPACPCATGFVEPCGYACSCKDAYMSGGCRRCCQYGSDEQRKAAAVRLASLELTPSRKIYLLFDVHHSFFGRKSRVFMGLASTVDASRDFAYRRRHPVDIVEVDLATFVWTEVLP